jgi:hypothetical protein
MENSKRSKDKAIAIEKRENDKGKFVAALCVNAS